MTKRDYSVNPIDLSGITIPGDIDDCPLDPWQLEVMEYWGDIAIRAGRQVGKSAVMAKKAALAVLKYPGFKILVSAGSERQAMYIFEKIKHEFRTMKENPFAETPTMRKMSFKNGSEIYCLPTGLTGDLVRGLTLNVWIPDEAAYINPQVRIAIEPMLWLGKKAGNGWTWALSTPNGKEGFFAEMFDEKINPKVRTWHIKSTDCNRIPQEELERWKKTKTRVQYTQEVLGEFVDEVSRLFPTTLLDSCFKKELPHWEVFTNLLGVDVARYGGDENAFVNARIWNKKIQVPRAETTERVGINQTYDKIIELNSMFRYNRILIDDAGVGGGLADFLMKKFRHKIICTNNASRETTSDGTKSKHLLKVDMYSYAIIQMEQGNVEILDNDELRASLESVQFEYDGDTIKIGGRYSHLAEAFVRALWGCKTKGLNLFVHAL